MHHPIYHYNLKEDQVIMKVDFSNDFNNICWDMMLCAVEYISALLPFIHSVYFSSFFFLFSMGQGGVIFF